MNVMIHCTDEKARDNALQEKRSGISEQYADKRKAEIEYEIEGIRSPETT